MAVVCGASGAETPAANGAGDSSCVRSRVLGRCTDAGRNKGQSCWISAGSQRRGTAACLKGLTLVGTPGSGKKKIKKCLGTCHNPYCYFSTLPTMGHLSGQQESIFYTVHQHRMV